MRRERDREGERKRRGRRVKDGSVKGRHRAGKKEGEKPRGE